MSLDRNALAFPDPEVAAILENVNSFGSGANDLEQARANFYAGVVIPAIKAAEPHVPPESEYSVRYHRIAVKGGEISVQCFIPTPTGQVNKTFPLLIYYHGGAWVFGGLEQDDPFLRALCVHVQMTIVNVDYRLAPEHPYPAAVNDSYTAIKWAVENASALSVDLSKGFIIGGLSAGGNLAAIMVHRAQSDPFFNGRKITGQFLQIPATCHPDAYPEKYKSELVSFDTVGDERLLAKSHMVAAYGMYRAPPADPECSPLLYPSHAGLPPTFLQVCGIDPLRDEGIIYERVLREDGVKTKIEIYPGVGHAFHAHAPETKSGKKFGQDVVLGFQWLLQGA
ncbi:hypothetical protein CERSUDRAFT_115950 [Gelatoporia subvermispora B]|uniref:Alpha/beta hydrolase fold-3 domain-containing protein n=1 Tax=Ceriporiopsis subvermispora (strain B) TaxID=914234 RepID=M2QVB2_CERS8|nr:hypothetical protein CERSUDRAFT_115950 [Gelatoporia subvermispora B]